MHEIPEKFRQALCGTKDLTNTTKGVARDAGQLFSENASWVEKTNQGSWDPSPWTDNFRRACVTQGILTPEESEALRHPGDLRHWVREAEDSVVILLIRYAFEHGKTGDGRVVRAALREYLQQLIEDCDMPYEVHGFSIRKRPLTSAKAISDVAEATERVALATQDYATATKWVALAALVGAIIQALAPYFR